MTTVSFTPSDFSRRVADSSPLMLKNRYFEKNPFLSDDSASLLARPGLNKFMDVGVGPIRGIFSESGTFDGDMFVASFDQLFRVDALRNATPIFTGLFNPERGQVNMAITGNIGTTPEFLFFADGSNLYVYVEDGYATGTLTGTPANNDVVRISNMYYKFTSGAVDTGTPDGTSGNPWLVALGSGPVFAFTNLANAVDASGNAGTQYSTATTANPDVIPTNYNASNLVVRSNFLGILGNGTVTTETGAALAWGAGTLTGGGSPMVLTVQLPDDVGCIDVAVVNSYVIVIPAQGEGINGRFYWIEPGEMIINPLNFATAERSPDEVYGVEVLGDNFYLPGASTCEIWYVSDNPQARMQRLQGVVFDRGTWQGTAVAIKESLILCDSDGGVFQAGPGKAPTRISTPDIEEQIRVAIQQAEAYLY